MSAREFGAGISPAMASLDALPAGFDPWQAVVDLRAEVEDLRGALAKIREVAGCDGSAPALLDLVAQVADQALRGAR